MCRLKKFVYIYFQIIIMTLFNDGVKCDASCAYEADYLSLQNLTDDWLKGNSLCIKKGINTYNLLINAINLEVTMYDLITYLHKENRSHEVKYLYISHSNVPEVQANSFKVFTNIKTIFLQHNHLKTLQENSFFNLSHLQEIDLSNNDLVEIGPSVFSSLPQLKDLFIFNNNLKRLHGNTFSDLSNLRKLNLENNDISEIGPYVFDGLSNLERLDLRNNSLTTLPVDLLPVLKSMARAGNDLELAGNPWLCNCSLKWMIQFVRSYKVSDSITCQQPDNISMSLFDLEMLTCGDNIDEKPTITTVAKIIVCVIFALCVSSGVSFTIWLMRRKNTRIKKKPFKMITNRHYYRPQSVTDSSGQTLLSNRSCKTQLNQDTKHTDVGFTELTVYGKVRLVKLLGRGAFGEVYEGIETGVNNVGRKVAVKRIKDDVCSVTETESLIKECENLKKVGSHQNIVEVYGSCVINGSRAIVMELAEDGDLKTFLRNYYEANRTVIQNLDCSEEKSFLWSQCSKLYMFMWHIAKGMAYLSSLKILHRDLAARNILLFKGPIAKISDFGLSRDVYESDYYYQETAGRLPYKWMSPETLKEGRYTTKSDVWSYGILLWEIMTLGGSPYLGILPEMLISMHNSGYIMPQPSLCPIDIYTVMVDCWKFTPKHRPLFQTLVGRLDDIIQRETKQIYIEVTTGTRES